MAMAGTKRRTTALLVPAATAADTCVRISPCEAFAQSHACRAACRPSRPLDPRLGMAPPGEGADADDDDPESVEAERRRLEAITGKSGGGGGGGVQSERRGGGGASDPPLGDWEEQLDAGPPPLTAIGRERLETEAALLRSLADGDGAVERLWELWYHERGPGPAAELSATDILVARGPGSYAIAEDMLRKLIRREGVYWTEAVNRLATLLFLQGRFEESREACEVVLRVKPWHFGALSGIVMVCQGLNDTEGVVGWAGQRMPPLQAELSPVMGDGVVRETRSEWVKRMVEEAQKRLRIAERGVQESFLDRDKGGDDAGAILGDSEDGAWE